MLKTSECLLLSYSDNAAVLYLPASKTYFIYCMSSRSNAVYIPSTRPLVHAEHGASSGTLDLKKHSPGWWYSVGTEIIVHDLQPVRQQNNYTFNLNSHAIQEQKSGNQFRDCNAGNCFFRTGRTKWQINELFVWTSSIPRWVSALAVHELEERYCPVRTDTHNMEKKDPLFAFLHRWQHSSGVATWGTLPLCRCGPPVMPIPIDNLQGPTASTPWRTALIGSDHTKKCKYAEYCKRQSRITWYGCLNQRQKGSFHSWDDWIDNFHIIGILN